MPRVASVQMDVTFGDREGNTQRIIDHLRNLKPQGVEIAVFPECAIGGYCVAEQAACAEIGISRDSEFLSRIQSVVDETGITTILGFAESTDSDYRNTAALLCPFVAPQFYEKTHLPELGYDRFVTTGDDLPVFDTPYGKLGIQICFDIRFPEAARILSLKGADAILYPTNWPHGADISADILALARAAENKVFVVTCNRVGTENGFSFIGKSKIIDPYGKIVAEADDQEAVLISDLDFLVSRNKRNVTIPGKHETTVFESRRPELYGPILSHTGAITSTNAVK